MLLARRAQLSLLRANTRAHSITLGACSPAAASGARTSAAHATRLPPRSLTTGSRAFAGSPARAFATASDNRTKEKEPSRWEKLQQLFREHGLAFGALYVGANVVTFVPIFGALTFGGVDGPELILWAADQLEITYDLSFVETIHKDLVNAFIALELNAWVEPVRLPAVIAYTPRASRWLKARRGGEVPVKAEPAPAPEEPAAPPRKNEKRRRRRRGG
jgi:hypothetical protein